MKLLAGTYAAPFEEVDFKKHAAEAVQAINAWIAEQTAQRIRNMLSGLDKDTRLVLVNAVYFKGAWATEFGKGGTKPRPFHLRTGKSVDVFTMYVRTHLGYAHRDGFTAVVVPYLGGEVQLLVILPDQDKTLPSVEAALTPRLLATLARTKARDIYLYLPKFKLAPPVASMGPMLQGLGLRRAFDPLVADFTRMAPVHEGEPPLVLSKVAHKAFIDVDEKGTEAAAATVAKLAYGGERRAPPKPIEVRVDRPFLFAIQHRASGACLFLGRVVDPR